jgi:RimJ/RimL family protein N-acetyltransferase
MIKGENIGLRAVEENDLELLRDWRNLPHFRKNFREVRELNLSNQKKWFEKLNNTSSDFMFTIVKLDNNEPVGACGLLYINWIIRSADFSFYIGHQEEYLDDKGYGGEAARLLIDYGFNILNLNKIWMELYEFDDKKLNFFIGEMGFVKEGKLRQNCFYQGKFYDSYIISLLAEEYKQKK